MKTIFNNGVLTTEDESLISALTFHPSNADYEFNTKFLNSFPDIPYKRAKKKCLYVSSILSKMNKNGIKITNNA